MKAKVVGEFNFQCDIGSNPPGVKKLVGTYNIQENLAEGSDPWKGMLSATAFAIIST